MGRSGKVSLIGMLKKIRENHARYVRMSCRGNSKCMCCGVGAHLHVQGTVGMSLWLELSEQGGECK